MTVYLDMDGVIADFFSGIEIKYGVDHWKSIQDRDIKFKELANTNFFHTLPIFREDRGPRRSGPSISCEIIRFVNQLTDGDWGICTSPMRGDTMNSAYWKRRWLEAGGIGIRFQTNEDDLEEYLFIKLEEAYNV